MIEKQPTAVTEMASGLADPITEGLIHLSGFKILSEGTDSEKIIESGQYSKDHILLARTKAACMKSNIQFADLTTIQRKFVTHYKCNQCGLLPLYYLDLAHVKRVRCTKCRQLVAFKRKGKYGKLRKEIALDLRRESGGSLKC